MNYDSALLERVAQRFRRDMWESVVPEAVTESGIEVQSFGPVLTTAFGDLCEERSLNQIQGAGEPGAIEEGHLAAAIEWMRAREVDYRVLVADSRPEAEEADAWLFRRGYERGSDWVKFIRGMEPPELAVDPEITIYALGEYEIDGEGMSAIAAEAAELPLTAGTLYFSLPQREPWRCYTAALGPNEPVVATAMMLIDDGVAQLGAGHTLEHARGRGCNTALLARRLRDAAAEGCHTAFVELWDCTPDDLSVAGRNLLRAGFEIAYAGHTWQRPELTSAYC